MKAIILAAGRGSRMNRLSLDRPKCLAEILGQPLLDLQLLALRNAGIKDIGLVTGYKREMLEYKGLCEFHNANWNKSNMVSSLACASEWLTNYDCIVSYSDIFYEDQIIKDLLDATDLLSVAYDPYWLGLWTKRFANPLDDAETFRLNKQGFITKIGEKPSAIEEIEGQYMGLLKFTPEAWHEAQSIRVNLSAKVRENLHMTNLLQKIINAGRINIKAIEYTGKWGEVDTADDLLLYNE
jgi:choline kinase